MEEYKEVYTASQAAQIKSEFSRLKDEHYLEHVGATLYSDKQIADVLLDLSNNVYGNPHAYNASSKFTEDAVDNIRYQKKSMLYILMVHDSPWTDIVLEAVYFGKKLYLSNILRETEKYRVLQHFNTTPDDYDVIFTSSATGALKLVAETFDYSNSNRNSRTASENGLFMYLEDNHTSVLGMREYARKIKTLSHNDAFEVFNIQDNNIQDNNIQDNNMQDKLIEKSADNGNSLFVYPAQCNFSGTKYALSWIKQIQNGALNKISGTKPTNWFCMLDAASFVSCNKLDLSTFTPDFICISFYKIFGYPSGLGALLVKNTSAHVLKKTYFGGGTVQMATHSEYIPRFVLHERFEDGTLPFLSITSLRHGFQTFKRFSINMETISEHTFSLARYVYHSLLKMHHSNEKPVAVLYHDTDFQNRICQGAIVNFNLLRANGHFIGYSEVLHMANLYRIHLRTGCFCNPGACQRHLKLTASDVKQQFNAGHVCGDQNDLINGYPTGSVRISFGYMSTKQDADKLLQMIQDCFISKPMIKKLPQNWGEFQRNNNKFSEINHHANNNSNNVKIIKSTVINDFEKISLQKNKLANGTTERNGTLEHIFVYPIKSCGSFSVPKNWEIEPNGLTYDREWMIVTSAGVCMSQKREPKMCLIMPIIKLNEGVLELNFPDMPSITVPLNSKTVKKSEISLCESKVCGDRVTCSDCGDDVADWICEALQISDLRLLRQDLNHLRTNRKGEKSQLSLANEAQFLLLNLASVNYLADSIQDFEKTEGGIMNLVHRFRANFVVNSNTPFIENNCNVIKIGSHNFKCTKPCTRCQMICIDQMTGEKTIEPLRTLSVLTESKIKFGVYLANISSTNSTISRNADVIFE